MNRKLVIDTGGEQQLSWTVVSIFWSFWTLFLMTMGALGVTDKFPWDDCFSSTNKEDADQTADTSHGHAGHKHSH